MVATSLLNYRLPATRLRDYPSYRSIMLSNIRKYTGLMFVVLILLFVGLVFLQSSGGGSKGYGSGAIVVMDDTTDIVKACHNLVRFFSRESCGKCTPCREGTSWLEKILQRIIDGNGRRNGQADEDCQ